MPDASGSGYYLVMRLNAYLPKRTIAAAIGEAVQRLQYSRTTEMQTSAIKEFMSCWSFYHRAVGSRSAMLLFPMYLTFWEQLAHSPSHM